MRPRTRPVHLVALLALVGAMGLGSLCGSPPRLIIESPAQGAFIDAPDVTVSGRIAHVSPSTVVLTVNGATVPVNPDGTWSTVVPLDVPAIVNPVVAELQIPSKTLRERITVLAGDSVPDGGFSPMGVALRLNDTGLDAVEPVVSSLVDLDLATLLPPGTLVIDDFCAVDTFLGCGGRVDVFVANPAPSFSTFGLDVDSMVDFAAGDVTVNDVQVDLDIDGSGLAPSCGLRITSSQVSIFGDYALQPDSVDPTVVDVNLLGQPAVSFASFNDEFTSGLCDFPLIGDLIQLIIGDIRPVVTDGLRDFLADPDGSGPLDAPIADGIETALADVQIAGPIGDSIGVNLEAPLFDIFEDQVGLTLDSDARITTAMPDPQAPDLLASYHVNAAFPSFAVCQGGSADGLACSSDGDCPSGLCVSQTPAGGPYGLGISLSSSAFNQLLKAEIESGLLRTVLTEIALFGSPQPVTAGLLSALVPSFGALDPSTPLEIRLLPQLAPVVTSAAAGPSGELAELKIPHLKVQIRDTQIVYLEFAVDATVGLDVGFANGELAFNVGSLDPAQLNVTILRNTLQANETFLEGVLLNVLPTLFPSLADALESFPLPDFLGLSLSFVEVGRSGEFITLFFDLQ